MATHVTGWMLFGPAGEMFWGHKSDSNIDFEPGVTLSGMTM